MNILVLVTATLMMLGMITYAKFDKFLLQASLDHQFENYMQFAERQYINDRAKALYDDETMNSNSLDDNTSSRNKNLSKLSIGVLRQFSITPRYQVTKVIFQDLIKTLYASHEFYQKMQQKKPDFVEEIVEALPYAVKNLPPNVKIDKTADLASLDFGKKDLNQVFYKMLKGANYPDKNQDQIAQVLVPSLSDYVTIADKKLRVYLASKKLLEVLFSEVTAQDIIDERQTIYREVHHLKNFKEASDRFKALFENKVKSKDFLDLLDFSVTNTNPKRYA